MQERVKAGVFLKKLSRVELSMKMFECRYALQISSARETPVSQTMVGRSRKKTQVAACKLGNVRNVPYITHYIDDVRNVYIMSRT